MKKILIPLLLILALLSACSGKKTGGDLSVKVSVDCIDVLEHPGLLKPEKASVVPEDGIFLNTTVSFSEGETAYDVLLRALQEAKLHYDVDPTKYVMAIGNLYTGDCGDFSGWLYTVNGESPTVGGSEYLLKNGDEVRYYYVTDFMGLM